MTLKDVQSTKFTELEIVSMWNKFKFEFPTGNVNKHQLKTLLAQVSLKTIHHLSFVLNTKLCH